MHNANEKQVGGTHYATGDVQHWDYAMVALNGRYLEGNITKYVARHRSKNGIQDLQKAKHYLQKLVELYTIREGFLGMRSGGSIGEMPAIVGEFIHRGKLNYWEGRVMVVMALWRDLNDLHEVGSMIDSLVKGFVVEDRLAGHVAEEPGAGYVDQDRTEAKPLSELEQFVLWLTVQQPCITFGSSIETPLQLDVLARYEALISERPSKHLNVCSSVSVGNIQNTVVISGCASIEEAQRVAKWLKSNLNEA